MSGWVYLPRFVDKIRLHLAGKLAPDYQENFLKSGFDAYWLQCAGLVGEDFIQVVKNTVTDGEVCDWVRMNVAKSDAEKASHREYVLNRGKIGDEIRARLQQRKDEAGLADREDIQTFVEFIDADERRT